MYSSAQTLCLRINSVINIEVVTEALGLKEDAQVESKKKAREPVPRTAVDTQQMLNKYLLQKPTNEWVDMVQILIYTYDPIKLYITFIWTSNLDHLSF